MGQPVYLATDRIRADQAGNLYTEGGGYVGRLGLYAFADNGLLEKNESGLFGANGQAPAPSQAKLHWKWVENANVETANFALLFEFDGDIKKIRHVLYNCSAARPNIESTTNEEEIEVQTETLAITAAPLANGYVKARDGRFYHGYSLHRLVFFRIYAGDRRTC